MRYEDKIWFSSKKTFLSMEHASDECWAEEWIRRIHEQYFAPSYEAIREQHGFASMVLICSAIEAIGTIFYQGTTYRSGKRFKLVVELLLGQTEDLSLILYEHYRCGLVHNGRTNQGRFSGFFRPGEFSVIDYNLSALVLNETPQGSTHKRYSVNPVQIFDVLVKSFDSYVTNQISDIGKLVKNEFMPDIQFLQS